MQVLRKLGHTSTDRLDTSHGAWEWMKHASRVIEKQVVCKLGHISILMASTGKGR